MSHDSRSGPGEEPRRVFMILSPRSLSYATYGVESLFRNCLETIHLHLITDSAEDKLALEHELETRQHAGRHSWSVYSENDLAGAEADQFRALPNLRRFRKGHPCWRKITDPLLLSSPGQEMVLLDPDLYFPNKFTFEPTPVHGVLLMWQKPTCLYPPETVRTAMKANIPLAHHVDIGVGQLCALVDLEWLDWLVATLNCFHRNEMHIEAIVWAALAMRIGGGYLDPKYWHCWRRTQLSRLLCKLDVSGSSILRTEPFSSIKCFHAGGPAKAWLAEAKAENILDKGNIIAAAGTILPFVEITPEVYEREQKVKQVLASLGYYTVFSTS